MVPVHLDGSKITGLILTSLELQNFDGLQEVRNYRRAACFPYSGGHSVCEHARGFLDGGNSNIILFEEASIRGRRRRGPFPENENPGLRGHELDLHAMTTEEAIPRLEKFIYSSFQTGLRRVWVVHGKGSGILRREVGRYLSSHSLVKSYGPADRWHGGTGVTQVELSDF